MLLFFFAQQLFELKDVMPLMRGDEVYSLTSIKLWLNSETEKSFQITGSKKGFVSLEFQPNQWIVFYRDAPAGKEGCFFAQPFLAKVELKDVNKDGFNDLVFSGIMVCGWEEPNLKTSSEFAILLFCNETGFFNLFYKSERFQIFTAEMNPK